MVAPTPVDHIVIDTGWPPTSSSRVMLCGRPGSEAMAPSSTRTSRHSKRWLHARVSSASAATKAERQLNVMVRGFVRDAAAFQYIGAASCLARTAAGRQRWARA
jgi:hypothetical protein